MKLSFLERMLAAPPPDPAKQAAAAAKSGATGPPADPPHLTLGLQVRVAAASTAQGYVPCPLTCH